MNPELKQRLIGAAVVTALATIFIPMLFDDPVDNKGQSVSELSIPAAPIKSTEVSANKLPTPAHKTGKAPDEAANSEEATDAEMVDDAEAEASAEPPVNESTATQTDEVVAESGQATAEPATTVEEEPELDTGVVPEAKPTNKKTIDKSKPIEAETVGLAKPMVKKLDANAPKLLPATKPSSIKAVEPIVKKPEVPVAKPAVIKPTVPTTATSSDKTAKAPELVRWTIHAGSFNQKDNATALMKSLREQHIPVVMETVPSAKGPMYRLKIGPELDKKKAAANKAKLDKQGVTNVMFAE
jgi:DedD protein